MNPAEKKKESSDTEGIGGDAGLRVLQDMEVDGEKKPGRTGFRPRCGGRASSGQAHVRQEVQRKVLQVQ